MPVVVKGATYQVEYNIPKYVDDKIPEYFYAAMAGELVSIFGLAWAKVSFNPYIQLAYDEEDTPKQYLSMESPAKEDEKYDLDASTAGWAEAFMNTCDKLDLPWFADYYVALEWYDRDLFDRIIEERIIKNFIKKEWRGVSPYFQYSCENHRDVEFK